MIIIMLNDDVVIHMRTALERTSVLVSGRDHYFHCVHKEGITQIPVTSSSSLLLFDFVKHFETEHRREIISYPIL